MPAPEYPPNPAGRLSIPLRQEPAKRRPRGSFAKLIVRHDFPVYKAPEVPDPWPSITGLASVRSLPAQRDIRVY